MRKKGHPQMFTAHLRECLDCSRYLLFF